MSVANVSLTKPQNASKAGLSPAMAFLGKKLFTTKKYEFARATLSTPGKIIGSALTLAAGGLAVKTLYDYVMDVADSAWNKITYLGSAAACGVLALTSFISSNVAENYKVITPEERLKDSQFKEDVFRTVVSSVLQRFNTPKGVNSDLQGQHFENINNFFKFLNFEDKRSIIELPYYSMKVKFTSDQEFYLEPLDDNQFILSDNKSRHKYTLRLEMSSNSDENANPYKDLFNVYILAKRFNDTGDYKQVGGPYPVSLESLDKWLNLDIMKQYDESSNKATQGRLKKIAQ